MDTVKIINRDGKDYKLVVLTPTGKGNPTIITGLTKEGAEELAQYHRERRQRLCDHLREVRRVLIEECGRSPDSFTPIVE